MLQFGGGRSARVTHFLSTFHLSFSKTELQMHLPNFPAARNYDAQATDMARAGGSQHLPVCGLEPLWAGGWAAILKVGREMGIQFLHGKHPPGLCIPIGCSVRQINQLPAVLAVVC